MNSQKRRQGMAKPGNTIQASERRILRKYLARYYRAKDKREILQGRLSLLRKDLPGKGGFMPPLSVPEIEAKIQQQTEAAEKSSPAPAKSFAAFSAPG